jgi:hypothetical protein
LRTVQRFVRKITQTATEIGGKRRITRDNRRLSAVFAA